METLAQKLTEILQTMRDNQIPVKATANQIISTHTDITLHAKLEYAG